MNDEIKMCNSLSIIVFFIDISLRICHLNIMYNIGGIQGVVQCPNFRGLRHCKKFVVQ